MRAYDAKLTSFRDQLARGKRASTGVAEEAAVFSLTPQARCCCHVTGLEKQARL